MSGEASRWDPKLFDDLEIGRTPQESALRVVRFTTEDKDDLTRQWEAMIRLAQRSAVSIRDIAVAAAISPQEVAEICNRRRRAGEPPVVVEHDTEPPQAASA
jgi:hypothetical protein